MNDHPGRAPEWAERAAVLAAPSTVAAYQRDGAVCLRGLLNAAELERLGRGIAATPWTDRCSRWSHDSAP